MLLFFVTNLKDTDSEVYAALQKERKRQEEGIDLIASENIASSAVLEATGSILTNKYSEGLPKKRYYGGNANVDVIEQLAIERAKKLFHAEHANVQPHSGANANVAAYLAVLKPGDTVLGMRLDHGGHLTHGHPINISGMLYNFVQYPVDKNGLIDYDEVERLALEHKPKLIIAGFSSYSRTLDFERFRAIADKSGSLLMADVAHIAGLICTGLHPSPFPACDIVTSTTHKTLRGPRGGLILCKTQFASAIDRAVFPGIQGGPLEHVIAAKAVAFAEASTPAFKEYQKQVILNAKTLSDELQKLGIKILSAGTDNHLMVIDLTQELVKGKELQEILEENGIYTNKNLIPFDTAPPHNPSGLRIGSPSVTSRGMHEAEMKTIAKWLAAIIKNPHDKALLAKISEEVKILCKKYPIKL